MKINGDEGDELVALREENARLRAALKEAVYEATHLSPQETDGSHWAKMSAAWLTRARAALDPQDAEIARLKAEVESYKAGNKDLLDWFNNLKADFDTLRAEIERLRAALDGAYNERNRLVAFIARLLPSGLKKTAIEGWDETWHGCVYIDLPTGQASWHYHDREAHLFDGLPPYSGEWDGHSTDEKYERIARAALAAQPAPGGKDE